VAFTRDGKQLGDFSLPNGYSTAPGGRVEQDVSRTWNDTVAALRGLAAAVPDLALRVVAIAVTGQGDGTWLIDDNDHPVAPALLWLDFPRGADRGGDPCQRAQRGALSADRLRPECLPAGPQLAWLQAHAPQILSRAGTVFHCKDWLYFA